MKKLTVPALLATALSLAGCVSTFSGTAPSIEMAYTTENPQGAGIVQVFDIGQNTVVQVRNLHTAMPTIVDESGTTLKYQVFGQNAVLDGLHNFIRVVTVDGTSIIKRNVLATTAVTASRSSAPPALQDAPRAPLVELDGRRSEETASQVAIDPATAEKYKDESPETLQAEIERMKKELAELKGLLSAINPGVTTRVVQPPPKPTPSVRKPSTIIIRFADNSDAFNPTPALRSTILDLTASATSVKVEGFTDSFTANRHAKALATLRAYAAKEYLVAVGVSPSKIIVKATPSGGFIADNRTKEGKAANRRVEITMNYATASKAESGRIM